MAVTLEVTPLPAEGAVRLEATTDAMTDPVTVLDLDGTEIAAEGLSKWGGTVEQIQLLDGLAAFYSSSSNGEASRALSGLTIGHHYRVIVTTQLTGVSTTFTAAGVTATIPAGTGQAATELTFTATANTHQLTIFTVLNNLPFVARIQVIDTPESFTWFLTRSDANGARPVRLYAGQRPVGGTIVVTDYEPAFIGSILYSVTIDGETASAMTTLEGSVGRSRIAPSSLPSQGRWYDLATELSVGRETTTTITQVINRPDPLVTLGSQTLRTGVLSVFAEDYAMGVQLEAVFNRSEVVFLRQPDYPGLDMYLVGVRTSLEIQPEMTETRRWILRVEYTEVQPPRTPLRGSLGWTIAASLERNATLAASSVEFPTVLALLIGPDA